MSKNVSVVTGLNQDKEEVTVVVKRPSMAQNTEAQMVESRVFNEGIKKGLITRARLRDHMVEGGEWDDSKDEELKQLGLKILAGERQLARGGRDENGEVFTKDQAKQLAFDIMDWRTKQLVLLAKTRENDAKTVEGSAENAKFDYLMSVSVYNEDETPHFENVEDYKNRANQDNPYINKAAGELANMLYNYDPEHDKSKAEFKFLVKYGYAREDGSFINEDKKLVDSEGRLVDEEGRWVNESGDYVDINGDVIDKDGNPVEEFVEFDDFVVPEKDEEVVEPQ